MFPARPLHRQNCHLPERAEGHRARYHHRLHRSARHLHGERHSDYSIEQWNYKWTSGYGSSDFKLSDPNAKGHDPVEIKSVQVNADKKTVFLEVPGLQPVDQMQIKMNLKSADGGRVPDKITNTINVVAKEQG
jgi:hypothetical protein